MRGLESGEKDLIKKENAVSEIMGVALMIGIVVIMISFEGAFIFARGGPNDLPHASLQEWMDTSEDKIYLKHCTGEAIKIEELEIVANINGNRYVCNSSSAATGTGNNGYWELGEVFEIDTKSEWGLDIKDYDEVDLYLIDTPTKDLIQKNRLTTDFRKAPYVTGWITPKGKSIDTSGGSANTSDVMEEEKDGVNCTKYIPPQKAGTETDPTIYQEFNFGINPCLYGYRPGDSLSNVTLKIVYRGNDNSHLKTQLKFYDVHDPSKWVTYETLLPEYNDFGVVYMNLTDYVNTTEDLANFKVRIEGVTNAASGNKEINIDYLALWIE
ncbi:type IV pilin N-terminal domain-containing protein [Methanosarcina sp. T3]|uniref:type IV pilin N-terminal domain-containing protein n=1 Tax=Methanosarcina sp. T3 TaxID=3439062 RepID=UPI003F86E621